MEGIKHMTNATKANVIALVNAFLLCLQAFGVPLTNEQQAAIGALVNAALVTWIGVTYKDSKARVPEAAPADVAAPAGG
jgi:hypothetical protein